MNLLEKATNLALTVSEQSFREQLPGPFLVSERAAKEPELEVSFQTSIRLPSVSKLQASQPAMPKHPNVPNSITSPATLQQDYILFSVEKTQRNTFTQGIAIGRTNNNDISLADGSVSKFHAWIQRPTPPNNEHRIFDAQSRYGTFVGGAPTPPNGAPLQPNATIQLGNVKFTFMTSPALYCWLREKLSR